MFDNVGNPIDGCEVSDKQPEIVSLVWVMQRKKKMVLNEMAEGTDTTFGKNTFGCMIETT